MLRRRLAPAAQRLGALLLACAGPPGCDRTRSDLTPIAAPGVHLFLAELHTAAPPQAVFVALNTGTEPRWIGTVELSDLASRATLRDHRRGDLRLLPDSASKGETGVLARHLNFETFLEPGRPARVEVAFYGAVPLSVKDTAVVLLDGHFKTARADREHETRHDVRLINVVKIIDD